MLIIINHQTNANQKTTVRYHLTLVKIAIIKKATRVVQWLRLCISTAGGTVSSPG